MLKLHLHVALLRNSVTGLMLRRRLRTFEQFILLRFTYLEYDKLGILAIKSMYINHDLVMMKIGRWSLGRVK